MAFEKAGPSRFGRRLVSGIAVAGLVGSVGAGLMQGRSPSVNANAQTAPQGPEENMGTFKEISVHDINAWQGKARLVDVREPHEYTGELGHIKGAELVPLASVGVAMQAWDPAQPVVVICRSGGRSGRAAEALAGAGFKNVMNMTGGMLAWNAAQLPVTR